MTPLWPPTTGMLMEGARERSPRTSATNVRARTTSRVVTPKILARRRLEKRTTYFNGHLLLGVKNTVLLEDRDDDGDSRVDRVGDDEDGGVGRGSRDACREIAHDAGVDLDQ